MTYRVKNQKTNIERSIQKYVYNNKYDLLSFMFNAAKIFV